MHAYICKRLAGAIGRNQNTDKNTDTTYKKMVGAFNK
jgi:hypothetical protein